LTEHTRSLYEELKKLYPDAKPELDFTNPYETLVATILAAQCTDKRVNMVTPAVFRDFPDPKAMSETTADVLFPYVRSCGFHSKAENIVNACKIIVEKHGGEVPSTMEALTALPGVGRKTANVVLANAFGVPAMAVDTHVFRVSNRLGLVSADTVEKTEKQLMQNLPPEKWNEMHHYLIYHGRRVCHSRKPDCENCTLKQVCDAFLKGEPERKPGK
jgi:endonuclease-3